MDFPEPIAWELIDEDEEPHSSPSSPHRLAPSDQPLTCLADGSSFVAPTYQLPRALSSTSSLILAEVHLRAGE